MPRDLRAIRCWPLWIRLALMGAALGAAYLLQIPLERDWPGEPFLLFLLVVMGTTLCFGTHLGLISAALSVFLSLYFFEPVGSPTLQYASDLNKIGLYAIIAFGCVVGFAFAEVRKQVEARRAIAESEARFRAAFENAAVGVVLVDPKGSFLQVNDTFARMLDYSTQELKTKRFQDLTHPDDLEASLLVLKKSRASEADSYCVEKRYVRKAGGIVWVKLNVSCVRKANGAIDYFISVIEDITHRKQAELALTERNSQLALAEQAALVGSHSDEPGLGRMTISDGYAAIYGLPAGTTETTRGEWRARVHPEDLARVEESRVRNFREKRDAYNLDYRIVLESGEVRWIEARGIVSYDANGQPRRVIGINIDVTERVKVEALLKESKTRLSDALAAGQVVAFEWDVITGRSQRSDNADRIMGVVGDGCFLKRVHPDDRGNFRICIRGLSPGNPSYALTFRFVRPDGHQVWLEETARGEFDCKGRLSRIQGLTHDITERKRAEEARKILNAELDHRVKNTLATVAAVISHTRQGSKSVAAFATALEGRIRSMAATHELLSSHHWQELSLIELIQRELAPYAARNNTEINGPTVLLKPEAGQAMAMVLHELATNAAKYGAFSTNKGRVSVRWDLWLNGGPHSNLVLEWREVDGPRINAHCHCRYGTSTIRDLIPYEFGGTVDLVFAPEGVRCRLELPANWLTHSNEGLASNVSHPSATAGNL